MKNSFATIQKYSFIALNGDIADSVNLINLNGCEALSTPFKFELYCQTDKREDSLTRWYGKTISCRIGNSNSDHHQRYIHGVISHIRYRQLTDKNYECIFTLEPMLGLLNLSQIIRIWQNISVPDLVRDLLSKHQIDKVKVQLNNNYPKREYCVQYRETTLEFIQRLLAEEGIYYYFEHSESAHTLILADNPSSHSSIQGNDLIFRPSSDIQDKNNVVFWASTTEVIGDKVAVQGINMQQAAAVDEKQKVNSSEKHLDSYGWFEVTSQGERSIISREAKNAMAAREANSRFYAGEVNAHWLVCGETFNLKEHLCDNGKYRIQSINLEASNLNETTDGRFHSVIQVMKNDKNWRPPYPLPRQLNCLLTGTVVGPSSEEIHTDEYGRIKVKFAWDNDYPNDDTCSCWIRVIQPWTGSKFGALFLPRVGCEVLVSFIHGNPEHPIVIGTLYNGKNKPPVSLPSDKTESGFFTRTTPKGTSEEGHRISFNDKKDEELLTIVSQKDLSIKVKNDAKTVISANRSTELTKGDDKLLLKEGNRAINLDKGDLATELKKGNMSYKIKGNFNTVVTSGHYSVKVTDGNVGFKCGKTINIEATNAINLKVGCNSIKISNTGITIKAVNLKLIATNQAELSGAIAKVAGSGMSIISGALIKIA